jgi:hypothetical protein
LIEFCKAKLTVYSSKSEFLTAFPFKKKAILSGVVEKTATAGWIQHWFQADTEYAEAFLFAADLIRVN